MIVNLDLIIGVPAVLLLFIIIMGIHIYFLHRRITKLRLLVSNLTLQIDGQKEMFSTIIQLINSLKESLRITGNKS